MIVTCRIWWENYLTWISLHLRSEVSCARKSVWESTQCTKAEMQPPATHETATYRLTAPPLHTFWNVKLSLCVQQLQKQVLKKKTLLNFTQVSLTYPQYLHCSLQALCLVFSLDQQSVHLMMSNPCLETKTVKMDQKLEAIKRASNHKSECCLFYKDRGCPAVQTWTTKLSPVPKSSWTPLSPLFSVFMHGLLPSAPDNNLLWVCSSAVQAVGLSVPNKCSLTASCSQLHYSCRRRRQECTLSVLPSAVCSGENPPPCGNV